MDGKERLRVTFIDLLSNSLVLRQTAPYITVRGLRRLAGTCRTINDLIQASPEAWRYLNLTDVKRAVIDTRPLDVGGVLWRAERMDESLTEDEFYAGPLRGIFNRLHSRRTLGWVQTLVLDGLTVPADLVREVLAEERYQVKVLSLRECRQLNVTILQQVLRYVCRPTRAEGTPSVKALYVFGLKDAPRAVSSAIESRLSGRQLGVMSSAGAQIGAEWNQRSSSMLESRLTDEESKWYASSGRAIKRPYGEWAETLQVCKGLIHFDAVLCRGPKHDITKVDSKDFLQPTVATVALGPTGCEICGSCPELPASFGDCDYSALPVLGPVPIHSSSLRATVRPEQQIDGRFPKLVLRCEDCLRGRWCEQCGRWWCENCYEEPQSRAHHETETRQTETHEELQRSGWSSPSTVPENTSVRVFSKLCVEHCLVNEMMAGAGSNGMWG